MMVAQENKEYVEKNSTQSKDENKSLPTSSMKSKISNFVKNITIEPAMFIMVLSMTMFQCHALILTGKKYGFKIKDI